MAPSNDTGFMEAAELAGFFVAHAIWSISDGETLVPLIGFERKGERQLMRLVADKLEDSVEQGKKWMETNPTEAERAIFIYDGFFQLPGEPKTDALICSAVDFGPPRRSQEIYVPYRGAKAPGGFAVFRPNFANGKGIDDDLAILNAAFWDGAGSHTEAAPVWAKFRDESR